MTKTKKNKKKSDGSFINLVERTIITKDNSLFNTLDNLCFLSKNMYNATLYEIRQAFINEQKYLTYNELDKYFRDSKNVDYLALPQKVSQQSIRLGCQAFTSLYASVKSKKANNETRKVHMPYYLDSTSGRQTILYTKQAVSAKKLKTDNYYTLSQVTDIENNPIQFKTAVKNIQFVRISHYGNHIAIEVGHKEYIKHHKQTPNIASIDLGINNIVTLTTNFDSPIIINGKPLKYINHEYNSKIAKIQSANKHCNNIEDNKWTQHMYDINLKRQCRINDYMHKISRFIVNYLVSNHVNTLIVGKNDGWKQNTNMSKTNNQNFVQIPFNNLIHMLEYKCNLQGIDVITICESHTSKCSFIDNEKICHHDNYLGNRKTRDLFYTKNNICINADVNGSYNIMKRWCISNNKEQYLCFNKYLVCKNPTIITLKLNGKKCDIGEYIN